ncbi:MAG: type III pantothenate kinase [Verrucomicrobiota bacterium]
MKNARFIFLDISNSWAKYCAGTKKKLGQRHRIPTKNLDRAFALRLKRRYPEAMLVAASVVPLKTKVLKSVWESKKAHFVSHRSPLGIKISYPTPQKIGADRLANAVAAAYLYPTPIIAIDFGTAVTFDVISTKKEYLGGAIAPGLGAMTEYLHERTALLPYMKLQEPRRIIGKSTLEAMQVGTVHGYRGLVKEIILQTRKALKTKKITIIATGGYAELIAKGIPEIQAVRPLLTLEGLQIIARNV